MNKLFLFLAFISFTQISCTAQSAGTDKGEGINGIKWRTFSEAVALNKTAPKKIFIDVYTEWCGWCKKMDASTFKDSSVVNYMNKYFYAVKMDAESKDSVTYGDHTFKFLPEYKANELAVSLLNGKMSYPSFVVMDENVKLLSPVPGYQTVDQLMKVITYFGDNIYLTKDWTQYSQERK